MNNINENKQTNNNIFDISNSMSDLGIFFSSRHAALIFFWTRFTDHLGKFQKGCKKKSRQSKVDQLFKKSAKIQKRVNAFAYFLKKLKKKKLSGTLEQNFSGNWNKN